MVEQFDSWIRELGAWGHLFLALAAFLEYVVPPFPGDTITVLGGVYAVRGERSWFLVFAAVTVGSVLGAAVDYGAGRALGAWLEAKPGRRLPVGITLERVHRVEALMREKGSLVIVLNRFLPTFRAVLFIAAGASRMPFFRVMALGAVSAMAWNALMLAAGIALGGNAERLLALVATYHKAAFFLLGLVGLVLVGRLVYKRRVRRKLAGDKGT